MSKNTTTSNPTADGDRFPSLTALRNAHSEMLTLHREKGNEPEIIAKIERLINKGRATGALLDSEDDRWAAQSLLDYWSSLLYRAGHEPPDAILVDLALSLIPDIPIDGNAIYRDIQTPQPSGVGSVAIGGNAQGAMIMTGNNNIISNKNNVRAGKYNINIAEGSNIKIGDTIYQGTDVKTTQTILIRVLNKFIIDNTFQKLFPPSKASSVDWEWGMKLLKQKQLPEIRKRLADNLGRDRILMDVSIEEQQNWVNRFPLAADRTLQIDGRDCGTLDANKMLIETFGRDDIEGKLLILGAPGAGKTTALLSLAEQLVEGAISQRRTVIPVIFELSTWRNDNQSIQDWLIEQLYDLHGGNRKSKLYEQWLERQVLLPLLDGLDELGLERQKKCTEKLNEFAEHYPQLVVCCRVKEFESADIKLRNLRGAVCLQSLSDLQIQHYLDTLKRPELWEAIQTNPSLQAMLKPTIEGDPGLLQVPLFVKLVADVYDPQQPISGKADLLDKYIDRQLSFDKREIDRRKELNEYKWAYKTVKLEPDWKKTRANLNWLARNLQANNQVEFLIENLQPSSIDTVSLQRSYRLIFWLFFWLMNGLILGLMNGQLDNIISGLTSGMFGGVIYGVIDLIIYEFIGGLMNGLFDGLIAGVITWMLGLNGLMIGLTVGLIGSDLNQIAPVESLQMSMSNAVKQEIIENCKSGLIVGRMGGLIGGLIGLFLGLGGGLPGGLFYSLIGSLLGALIIGLIGLFFGLIIGLIRSQKQELKVRSRPNQSIWNSFQSQICITVIIFVLLTLLFTPFYLNKNWRNILVVSISFSLFFGFAIGGGKAWLQHLSLRIILRQSGLPWNFARFLNYCVERRLLLRVGGGYRFLHRELLDHFTQSSR